MSNKKKYLISGGIVLLLILSAISLLFKAKNVNQTGNKPQDGQNYYADPYSPLEFLEIIATSPVDEAKNIPVGSDLKISFSRNITADEIEFSIAPTVPFSQTISGSNLTINFETILSGGTRYTYIIKYPNQRVPSGTYSFITEGPLRPLPNTQPEGAEPTNQQFLREQHPDVFLANYSPYNTGTFSITHVFDEQNQKFRFTVTSKSEIPETGKNDFLTWLKTLELTDNQIQFLEITYK